LAKTLREVPLRRLLWQVITPGETFFRVSTVVERLAALGLEIEPAKVSNALGYWVDHHRLVRVRKGVYTYPAETLTPSEAGTDAATTGVVGGSAHNDRSQPGSDHNRRAVVARGQEDRSGQSPTQERRKAV
jgi:hypothetical protein